MGIKPERYQRGRSYR